MATKQAPSFLGDESRLLPASGAWLFLPINGIGTNRQARRVDRDDEQYVICRTSDLIPSAYPPGPSYTMHSPEILL